LRTGEFATLAASDGVPATGLKHDPRSNLLFVARAGSGMGTIFNAESGDVVASYQFKTAPTFINDVVITREAAYFTDTQAPFLYKVALGPAASQQRPSLRFHFPARSGPTVSRRRRTASISSSSLARRCSSIGSIRQTHTAVAVNLGGGLLPNADGLLLDGKTLYVVQNFRNQIAVVELSPDYLSGTIGDPDHRTIHVERSDESADDGLRSSATRYTPSPLASQSHRRILLCA
jgi:sugar lactone lactonase YvrE